MSIERAGPPEAHKPSPSDSTVADRLRALLERAGLSQRAAARLLNIDERMMRQWCAGVGSPPESVFRALNPRLTHTEHLCRMIESNEKLIEAIRDGRITGMGYGPGPSDPLSAAKELDRLRKENDEHRAMVRWEAAFQRKQDAFFALNRQWLPHGSGQPTDESIAELDAAESELRAAQAEVDRITWEIRGGKR